MPHPRLMTTTHSQALQAPDFRSALCVCVCVCHILSYSIISNYTILYYMHYIVLYYIILYHMILCYYIMLHDTMRAQHWSSTALRTAGKNQLPSAASTLSNVGASAADVI